MVPEVWINDKAFPFRNDLLWTGLGENDFLWAKHVNKWLFVQSKHWINDSLTKWLVVQSFIPSAWIQEIPLKGNSLFILAASKQDLKRWCTDSAIFDATLIQIFDTNIQKRYE